MTSLQALCSALPQQAPLVLQAGEGGFWAVLGEARIVSLSELHLALAGEADGTPFTLEVGRASEGAEARLSWQGVAATDARWFAYGAGMVVTATLLGGAVEVCLWPGDGGVYVSVAGVASAYLWLGAA